MPELPDPTHLSLSWDALAAIAQGVATLSAILLLNWTLIRVLPNQKKPCQ
jgi:hypothetical protein